MKDNTFTSTEKSMWISLQAWRIMLIINIQDCYHVHFFIIFIK